MSSERTPPGSRTLGLLGVLLAAGCTQAPHGTLTGRAVLEGEDTSSGIVVSVSGPSQGGAVTGDDGSFTVGGLLTGTYSVLIVAPDSVEGTRAFTLALELPGAGLDDVTFHPTGRATGTIIDASTQLPLEGALVLSPGSRATATTLADGTFELAGIATGDATLLVSASGFAPAMKRVRISRASPIDAGSMALVPGATAEGPTGLGGKVVLADGTPAQAARVHAASATAERETVTAADGSFHFDDLTRGVVTVDVALEGYEARGLTVLALAGTNGLVVDPTGLYPLEKNAIELTAGHLVTPLTGVLLTPDGRTLLAVSTGDYGFNLRATALDGGTSVELLEPSELGASRPRVAAVAADSTTLAVSATDSSFTHIEQIFLVSTVSRGRQLIANHGCALGQRGDVLYAIVGGDCYSGGPLYRVPLRFGATPVALGQLSARHWLDLAHDQIFDMTPVDAASGSLDVIALGPQSTRRTVVPRIAGSSVTISPDGKQVFYEEADPSFPSSYSVVSVATGTSTHVLAGVEAWSPSFPGDGSVVVNAGSGNAWSTWVLLPGATTASVIASQARAEPAPGGGVIALHRPDYNAGNLGPLSLIDAAGGAERPVASDVIWFRWSSDGQQLYFIDSVILARQRGRLARASRAGDVVTLATGVASDSYPSFSADEAQLALVVRDETDAPFAATWDMRHDQLVTLDELDHSSTPYPTSWSFSPGGRWLAFTGLLASPRATVIRPAAGGPLVPVSTGSITWLDASSALVVRYGSAPWSSLGGTYLARF